MINHCLDQFISNTLTYRVNSSCYLDLILALVEFYLSLFKFKLFLSKFHWIFCSVKNWLRCNKFELPEINRHRQYILINIVSTAARYVAFSKRWIWSERLLFLEFLTNKSKTFSKTLFKTSNNFYLQLYFSSSFA